MSSQDTLFEDAPAPNPSPARVQFLAGFLEQWTTGGARLSR